MQSQEPSADLQVCPTRIDGAPVLFAHKVTLAQCQDRQRGHYHKCFTCAFNNVYVTRNGSSATPLKPQAQKKLQVG